MIQDTCNEFNDTYLGPIKKLQNEHFKILTPGSLGLVVLYALDG